MIPSKIDVYTQKKYFEDVSFSTLMRKRIYNVLLVSSVYDAFMLEEDGRIEEQIFYEDRSFKKFLEEVEPEIFPIKVGTVIVSSALDG